MKPAGPRPATRLAGYKRTRAIYQTFPFQCSHDAASPDGAVSPRRRRLRAGQWELFIFQPDFAAGGPRCWSHSMRTRVRVTKSVLFHAPPWQLRQGTRRATKGSQTLRPPHPQPPPASAPTTPTRTRTQMKMLRGVQNERFTFEIDKEKALVGCTLER